MTRLAAANVCAAAEVARARGLKVLGLTGEGGGKLAPLCDLCIRVPAKRTLEVQELHLPVYHTICLLIEDEFFSHWFGGEDFAGRKRPLNTEELRRSTTMTMSWIARELNAGVPQTLWRALWAKREKKR